MSNWDTIGVYNRRAIQTIIAINAVDSCGKINNNLTEIQTLSNLLRRGLTAFKDLSGRDDLMGIVINLEEFKKFETLLFDAREAFLRSLEPSEAMLEDVPPEAREFLLNMTMESRQKLAESRKDLLDSDGPDTPEGT